MTIRMYDLAGADPALRFSPFCWRTRLSLAHKGLAVETIPWRFTETAVLAETGSERVPVILDRGAWIKDSWTIARHLDATYPDKPLMHGEAARAHARLVMSWCDMALHPLLARVAMLDILQVLPPEDQAYFRSSRERRFGMTLEQFCSDSQGSRRAIAAALAPIEQTLADHAFLGGAEPNYADYALIGSLMWTHVVCREPVLVAGSKIAGWFERCLDLHGGLARSARRAAG